MEEVDEFAPLEPVSNPTIAGGNIVVQVDEEEYKRRVEDLKFNVTGKSILKKWDLVPTTMEIRRKLLEYWDINDLKLIPLGKGIFHIVLDSLKDQFKSLSVSLLLLKPGVMRFNRWVPGNNSSRLGSISQVWIRIYHLPLFIIARGWGYLLKLTPS